MNEQNIEIGQLWKYKNGNGHKVEVTGIWTNMWGKIIEYKHLPEHLTDKRYEMEFREIYVPVSKLEEVLK